MCKNSHFRLSFQKEHGKRVSTLFKFERQNLYHIYWSTRRQLSCKKSLLVLWKRSRLFVNTTSAVDKCSLPNRDNLMQPIHRILSQKLKNFSQFYLGFSKSLIAYLFVRLRPAKNVVRYMFKSPASDYPSKMNIANESQLWLNLSNKTCTIFIDQREGSLVQNVSFSDMQKLKTVC